MASQTLEQVRPLKFIRLDRIGVDDIVPNKQNPRDPIARKEVEDLRKSIEIMGGILVPLVVYERGDGKYVLLDGERRWRAAKELKFEKVPVNIIEKPSTDFDNLRTMFNIHLQRREWSTAARAIGLGRLLEMRKELTDNPQLLRDITGMSRTKIEEAKLLLKCPDDLVKRCLDGTLNEYYLILIARGLDSCFRAYPEIMQKYSWDETIRAFVKKIDQGWVRNVTASRALARIASKCVDHRADDLFVEVFQKLRDSPDFNFEDAETMVDSELGYKVEDLFRKTCEDFLTVLKSYQRSRRKKMPDNSRKLLDQILDTIRKMTRG
jgi:ParB/RepB/Spo0J family partition protein